MTQGLAVMALLLHLVLASGAEACDIAEPEGDVILAVDGMINGCNAGREVRLDRQMLDRQLIERLPNRQITTENPWGRGGSSDESVGLADVLRFARADDATTVVSAPSDYRTDNPVVDLDAYRVVLADKRDGADLPVRDRGPLFVVFPFSDHPELRTDVRYAQSVWQVNRITVK